MALASVKICDSGAQKSSWAGQEVFFPPQTLTQLGRIGASQLPGVPCLRGPQTLVLFPAEGREMKAGLNFPLHLFLPSSKLDGSRGKA